MTNPRSTRLSLAALAAASSFIALASPASAQSTCVGVAGTITCTPGATSVTLGTTTGTTIGGQLQGLRVVTTGDQTVTGSGTVTTDNGDSAVVLTTGGNLAVAGDAGGLLNASAIGTGNGFVLNSGGTTTAALGTSSSATGTGLRSVAAGNTAITTGSLTSSGTGGALVTSSGGNAALTVNGDVAAAGTNGFGAVVLAPTGSATLNVTGNITNTATGSLGYGAIALGQTGATVNVGNVTIAGDDVVGVGALANAGTASVTCGNVSTTGPSTPGVAAIGTDVVIRCGNVTTSGVTSPGVIAGAINSIDAQVGNVTTSGATSPGLTLTAPGPITATTGNISATGDGSAGLVVAGTDGAIDLTTGTVTTTGLTADGIDIAAAGTAPVTLHSGRISATGTGSTGLSVTTIDGSQNLTVAGIAADLDGIDATAQGTGSVTIATTAPVSSVTAYGINAASTTGAITVTEAGASGALGGVIAQSDSGTITLNASGGTTTSTGGDAAYLLTGGTATTNVAAGASVIGTNGFDAIDSLGAGGNVVNNRGTVSAGVGGYAVQTTGGTATVNNLSGGTLIGPLLLGAGDDTVTNAGTMTLTNTTDLGAGNDTLTNSGTLSFTGTTEFGLGNDVLANQAGGSLALDQGATLNGLEALNNGGAAFASGTTTLNGTTFNNLAGGTLNATNGTATLAGLTAFNNAGTINLADGATGDVLTLGGNYTGSGGARLAIDAAPGLGTADRLVIAGNAGGSTLIDVAFANGAPLYNPTGVLVVDAGGSLGANAFTLNQADVAQGFVNYGLRTSGNDVYLASTLDASVGELSLISSAGPEMWYQSFDAYHDAIMGRQGAGPGDDASSRIGIWSNLYLSRDKFGDQAVTSSPFGQAITYSQRTENKRRGAQGGLEYRGGMFTVGITGGYEHNKPTFGTASQMDLEGHNYGAYALFGMANGLYGGVMYKRDNYRIDFENGGRAVSLRTKGHSSGVDGELGLRFGTGLRFDLNGGLSYVKSHIDPYQNYGLTFGFDKMDSLRARLGGRVIFDTLGGAFIGVKGFHEFRNDRRLDVSNNALIGSVDGPGRGTWGRAEVGVGATAKDAPQFTLWADFGDTTGVGGRLGFHF